MKIATNIKKAKDFGFQLVIDERNLISGVNLYCGKQMLVKHKFSELISISNLKEETNLINNIIISYLSKSHKI
jgi:hypothetical protein